MARKAKRDKAHQIEPSWYESEDGQAPLTELLAENQGALSPFGEDTVFPLPVTSLSYQHPTAKPNRADYE